MRTKRILKIIAVVFAVLFGLTVVGGIVYTAVSEYRKQSNDSCAVAECTDNTTLTGTKSNYKELSTVKSTVVAYAGELTTTETITNIYSIFAPAEAFPITFYGYNGTSKKSTTIKNDGGELTVTTTFLIDSDTPDYRRILTDGTISYMLAVDKQGYILYADLVASDDYLTFPLTATLPNESYIDLYLTYTSNDIGDKMQNGYDSGKTDGLMIGYNQGHATGYDEGYSEGNKNGYNSGYNDGKDDGIKTGYDEGYSAGYSYGSGKGYDTGFEEGEKQGYQNGYDYGYDNGYNLGYVDGENKSLSTQLTNPISSFLQPVHEFMNTKFFGDLTYASIFNVMLFVAVALIFLKMFSGG